MGSCSRFIEWSLLLSFDCDFQLKLRFVSLHWFIRFTVCTVELMVANSPNTWRNLEHMFQLFVGLFAVRRRPMDEPSATNGQRQECVAVDDLVNHATRITNIRGRKSIERALPSIRRAMIYQIFIAAVIGLTIKSPDLSMARWWRHVRIANNKQSNFNFPIDVTVLAGSGDACNGTHDVDQ